MTAYLDLSLTHELIATPYENYALSDLRVSQLSGWRPTQYSHHYDQFYLELLSQWHSKSEVIDQSGPNYAETEGWTGTQDSWNTD